MSGTVFSNTTGNVFSGFYANAGQALTDDGAATVDEFYTSLTTTGAAAVTLADGEFPGQLKLIHMIVDAGDATLTPTNLTGGDTITFANVGEAALLLWDGASWVPIMLANLNGGTAPAIASS